MKSPVTAIEILEDLTATSRCNEGFLHVHRFRCQSRREDGSTSPVYRVDVVDRPGLDAVAVLIYRSSPRGIEVLTRQNLRPAAYFRKSKTPIVPDPKEYLRVEEIVAGVVETTDQGRQGILDRAAAEVWEESGYRVDAANVEVLGGPFFVAPGILSEKIHITAVDVTGLTQALPEGDGSPLEEGSDLRWYAMDGLLAACQRGDIPDAKTEIAVARFKALKNP